MSARCRDGRIGFSALELLIVLLVAGLAAAMLLPPWLRSRRNDRIQECVGNLRALGQAAATADPGSATGPEFWEEVARAHPEIRDRLRCPLAGRDAPPYRGPTRPYGSLRPEDLLGADQETNHGDGQGGAVLLKSGKVRVLRARDGDWKLAGEETK